VFLSLKKRAVLVTLDAAVQSCTTRHLRCQCLRAYTRASARKTTVDLYVWHLLSIYIYLHQFRNGTADI